MAASRTVDLHSPWRGQTTWHRTPHVSPTAACMVRLNVVHSLKCGPFCEMWPFYEMWTIFVECSQFCQMWSILGNGVHSVKCGHSVKWGPFCEMGSILWNGVHSVKWRSFCEMGSILWSGVHSVKWRPFCEMAFILWNSTASIDNIATRTMHVCMAILLWKSRVIYWLICPVNTSWHWDDCMSHIVNLIEGDWWTLVWHSRLCVTHRKCLKRSSVDICFTWPIVCHRTQIS